MLCLWDVSWWNDLGEVIDRGWARLRFWERLMCVEVIEGDKLCRRVRREGERFWGCVWDCKIDETEI